MQATTGTVVQGDVATVDGDGGGRWLVVAGYTNVLCV